MGRPKNFSREDVLEKAIPLFWRQGFADTSLQDLEKATGVNKSGLYSEFESKEDLFLESLKYYISTRDGSSLKKEPLGLDNVKNFLLQSCPAGQIGGCLAVYSMRELSVVPQEAHDLLTASFANLKRLISANIAAANPKMDADAIADIVWTFFSGLCLEQNLGRKRASTARKVEDLIRIIAQL